MVTDPSETLLFLLSRPVSLASQPDSLEVQVIYRVGLDSLIVASRTCTVYCPFIVLAYPQKGMSVGGFSRPICEWKGPPHTPPPTHAHSAYERQG